MSKTIPRSGREKAVLRKSCPSTYREKRIVLRIDHLDLGNTHHPVILQFPLHALEPIFGRQHFKDG